MFLQNIFEVFDLATITTEIMSFYKSIKTTFCNKKYTNLYFTYIAEVQTINQHEDI